MRRRLALWELGGFLFTAALGTVLHFTYGWNGGNLLAEDSAYQKVITVKATTKDGVAVVATSKPLKVGNATAISFNGIGRSVSRRGINITVYDKTKKCVCDSVCFDTHVKSIDCHR